MSAHRNDGTMLQSQPDEFQDRDGAVLLMCVVCVLEKEDVQHQAVVVFEGKSYCRHHLMEAIHNGY